MVKRQQAAAQGKGFGLLFEMGCGKTLTAIAIAGAAYEKGAIEKVLVVAPTSVCSVWPKEFKDYADFKYKVNVLLGDKKKRLQELEALNNFPFKALKVAVINYESTWREGLFEALIDWKPDMVIADESQRIKTPDAEQSKAMHQIGDIAKYKLILSGTPVQNDAIDLFSQYRFLNPNIFGYNFYAFRGRYAIMGGFNRKQIVGYKDLDQLIQKEHSIAYRVTKAEALDLPEQTFLTRYIQLAGKEKQLYDKIKKDSFAAALAAFFSSASIRRFSSCCLIRSRTFFCAPLERSTKSAFFFSASWISLIRLAICTQVSSFLWLIRMPLALPV